MGKRFFYKKFLFEGEPGANGGGDTPPPVPPKDGPTVEELQKQLKEQSDLLKNLQKENSTFKTEKEKAEEEKLKANGQLEELLKKKEEQLGSLSVKMKERLMDTQVIAALKEVGCKSPEAFIKVVGGYSEKVKFDDDFNADAQTLKAFIDAGKEQVKDLGFFTVDNKPPADGGHGGSGKDIPYSEALKKCKTQKEFDEVRKKYNR